MNDPSEIEVRAAVPIEIPQVEVIFPIPQSWKSFATSPNVNFAHRLENWVTGGFPGRVSPRLSDRHCETFPAIEARSGGIAVAASGEDTVPVVLTVRLCLWELFVQAVSNVGKSNQYVLLVLLADAMRFEREDGSAVRENLADLKKDKARQRAEKPAVPGRVIDGPWKAHQRTKSRATSNQIN